MKFAFNWMPTNLCKVYESLCIPKPATLATARACLHTKLSLSHKEGINCIRSC